MRILICVSAIVVFQTQAQCVLKKTSIGNFMTVSGKEIPNCIISYRTQGRLNKEKSNVILWPTWFTGKSEMICGGVTSAMMDTTGLYIIVIDALGNGLSSSPSNCPSFPEITVRDMVNSEHTLLTKHLGISHLKAVMGISMGGMQTMEWIVAYPGFADKAIPIVGTPQQSAYDQMLWKTEASILLSAEKNMASQDAAMRMVSNVHLLNLYTPAFWFHAIKAAKTDSVMQAHQEESSRIMRPDDWLCQLNAMIAHDIYKSCGKGVEAIKEVIKAKVLVIVSKSDHMVNPGSSVEFSNAIAATLLQVDNDCGHIGIFCDQALVKDKITGFLRD